MPLCKASKPDIRPVNDFPEREAGIDLDDVGKGGEPVAVYALVVFQVACGDTQNVVVLARH